MRFAYVGLGEATRSLHLPAMRKVRSAQPVGGCDPHPERRDAFAEDTGLPTFAGLADMLAGCSPEVVVIATPPDSHADLCVEALEEGAHVICEKPLAPSVAEADLVLAAAERTGRRIAVNHGVREQPIFRALRERIGSPEAGAIVFCQVWQLLDQPPWEEEAPWRAAAADRALLEAGVHLVDLMLCLFDEPPEAVWAQHSDGATGRDSDAIWLATLDFGGGRLGHLTIDRLCRGGDRYAEVRADCEHASLRASWGGRATARIGKKRAARAGLRLELAGGGIAWEERGRRRRTIARDSRRPQIAGTAALLEGIVEALESGREPPSSGREARLTLEVIEAAYRSAQSGERVALESAARGVEQQRA